MTKSLKVLFIDSGGTPHPAPFHDVLSTLGVSVGTARLDIAGNKITRYLASPRHLHEIRQKITSHDPDIIVFYDERDRAGLLAVHRANKTLKKPVIWFRGAVGGYNALSPLDRYLLGNGNLARIVARSYAIINNWTGSPAMNSLLRNDRIECCHHFIQLKPVEATEIAEMRADWQIAPDDIVIGSIANVRPIKNIELAVKAASAVRCKNQVRFLLIGPYRNDFLQRLEQMMPGRLVAPGAVPDAGRYAGIFDIFVSPTRRPGEGFGLALAEAMACGAPVVASHAGGAGDIVEHGKTGFLLPENEMSWRRILQMLVSDPSLRRRMGQAGQMRIAERFSVETIAADFLRILQDVFAESQGQQGAEMNFHEHSKS